MKQLLILTLLSLTMACGNTGAQDQDQTTEAKHRVLSKAEFEKRLSEGDIQLVDVRTPNEYAAGHIEGAINANVMDPNFPVDVASKTDTSKQVMIYCRSGKRSDRAAKVMEEMGYPMIYDLDGGYLAWSREQ
ncbi:MAG TPA: rhodanese-like domain-containing protein [Saprospiraceae bacterium]|nr:rhodanese-like domain-containing protein [Saprospiraceae bacterium]